MKKITFLFLSAALIFGALSCQREVSVPDEKPARYATLQVNVGRDTEGVESKDTKSIVTSNVENFQKAILFAMNPSTKKVHTYGKNAGDLEGQPIIVETSEKTFNWALPVETRMDIYALVNYGDIDVSTYKSKGVDLTISDLEGITFSCTSANELAKLEQSGYGLPMAGITEIQATDIKTGEETISIKVKKLFARYNLYLDLTDLVASNSSVVAESAVIYNMNNTVHFFKEGDKKSTYDFSQYDRATEEQLEVLQTGGNSNQVVFYVLENMQGDMSGATSWQTVYRDLGADKVKYCTYLNFNVNVVNPQGRAESRNYRIYLGKTDMKSNFDVQRNYDKTIKLAIKDVPSSGVFQWTNSAGQPDYSTLTVAQEEEITLHFKSDLKSDEISYKVYNADTGDAILPSYYSFSDPTLSTSTHLGSVKFTPSSSINVGTMLRIRGGSETIHADRKVSIQDDPVVLDFAYSDDFLHSGHSYGAGYEALHVGRRGYIAVNYTSGSSAVKTIQWSVNSESQSNLKIGTDGNSFTPVTSANNKNGIYLYCYNGGQSGAMLSYKVIGLDDSVIQEGTLNLQLMSTAANSSDNVVYIPAITSKETYMSVSVSGYTLTGIGFVSASDFYAPLANSIGLFNAFTSFTPASSNPEFSISGANISYAPTSEEKFIQHINSCATSRNGYYSLGSVNASNGLLTANLNIRLLAPFVTGSIISAEDTGYGQWNKVDTWYKTFDFTNRYTRNNAAMTGDVITTAVEKYGDTYEDFKSHFIISYEIDAPGDNSNPTECATIAAWFDDSRQAVTYGYEKKFTYAADKWTDYKTVGDLKPAKGTVYIQFKDGSYSSNKYAWFEFYRAVSYGVYLDASVTLNGTYCDFAVKHHIVSFNFPNLIQNPTMGTIGEVGSVYYIANGPWQVIETSSTNEVRSWIKKGMTWANNNSDVNIPYECSVIAGDAGVYYVGNLSTQNPIYVQRFEVNANNEQMHYLLLQCYSGTNMDAFYRNYAPQIDPAPGVQTVTASDGTHYFGFTDSYFNRPLIIFIPCQTPNYTPVYPTGVYSGGPVPANYYNDIICWGRPW